MSTETQNTPVIDVEAEAAADAKPTEEVKSAEETKVEQSVWTGYCMSCKDKVEYNIDIITPAKNDVTEIVKGVCPICATKVSCIRAKALTPEQKEKNEANKKIKEEEKEKKKDQKAKERLEKKSVAKAMKRKAAKELKGATPKKPKVAKKDEFSPVIVEFEKENRELIQKFKKERAARLEELVAASEKNLAEQKATLEAEVGSREDRETNSLKQASESVGEAGSSDSDSEDSTEALPLGEDEVLEHDALSASADLDLTLDV